MRSYFKDLIVEEEAEGNIVTRKVQIVIYPILNWYDEFGAYHQLTMCGSDLDWLSEIRVSVAVQNV